MEGLGGRPAWAGLAEGAADEGVGFGEGGVGLVGKGLELWEGDGRAGGYVVEEIGRGEVFAGVEGGVFGFLKGEGVVGEGLGIAGGAGGGGLRALLLLGVLEAAGFGVGGSVSGGGGGRRRREG